MSKNAFSTPVNLKPDKVKVIHGRKGQEEKMRIGIDRKNLDASFAYPYLGPRLRQMRISYYFMQKFHELSPTQFHILNYDALLLDPQAELLKLCQFLDLDYHDSMTELTLCGQPIQRIGWSVKKYTDSSISPAPLTAWKEQLSGIAIRLVNLYFADVLEDHDYERVESRYPLWKKADTSEDIRKYVANRLLFTKPVRKLI